MWQLLIVFLGALLFPILIFADNRLPLQSIQLPPGFTIDLYAELPGDPGELAVADDGTVLVGSENAGQVYALLPTPDYQHAEKVITLIERLHTPYGVAFTKGDLYVATRERILRYDNILTQLTNPPRPKVVYRNLPNNNWHGNRYLKIDPYGRLYVSIGIPCNICLMKDKIYGTILRMQRDGTGAQIFAQGIRYSLGFAWHPVSSNFWFSDIGQTNLGSDIPTDEINVAIFNTQHFGFPYVHSHNISNDLFGDMIDRNKLTPPAFKLAPQVSPKGLLFYTGAMFPQSYQNHLFVALHGDDASPLATQGHKIIWLKIENNRVRAARDFATGWRRGDAVWGSPTDLAVLPDGSMLISDSKAHAIYRISCKNEKRR